MKFATTKLLLLLFALCLSTNAAPPPMSGKVFTLVSNGFEIRINSQRAWSLDQIKFNGKEMGQPTGNYGLVWAPMSGKYIGGAHHQGGREEVLDLTLTVDGKPVDLNEGGRISVKKEAEFIKESRLGDLRVRSITRFKPRRIEFQRTVNVEKDTHVHIMFPFMFCWTPQANRWLAKSDNGQILDGTLKSDKDWALQKNVRWCTIYDSKSQVAMLTEIPPDMNGVGRKNAYWDLPAYHKQYFQSMMDQDVKKGQTFQYRLTLRGFQVAPSKWKSLIQSQAFEMEGDSNTSSPMVPAAPTTQSAMEKQVNRLYPPYHKGETPDWMTHPVAMAALDPDTVLKPWTPIQADKQSVIVWGRRYELGGGGLPKQVRAADQTLLAGPVQLTIQLNGQKQPINLANAELVQSHKGLARYVSRTNSGQASVQIHSDYEYDGFSRFDVDIQSLDPLVVDRLEVIIPIQPDHALLYHNAAAWHFGQSQATSAQAGALPSGKGEIYSAGFKPYFWIGDHDRGISWFSESDQWMLPADNEHVMRVVRRSGRTELHIVYIDRLTTLPKTIQFSFGLMATPVKPLPPHWRNWRISNAHPGEFHPNPPPAIDQLIFWSDAWRIIGQYPRPRDPVAFKQAVTGFHEKGAQRVYPYLDVTLLGTREKTGIPGEHFMFTTPEWAAFGKQWKIQPNNYKPGYRYVRVSPASHWADFSLWCVKQWIVKGGVDGIYTDEAFPYADTSAAHGCGYTDTDGNRHPTWPIYATRNYFKRLAYLFQKHAKGPPAILAHTSATIAVPYLSFADAALDGEQFYHTIKKYTGKMDPSYLSLVPLDRYQAELMTQQVGLVPVFLPEFRPDITDQRFPGVRQRVHPTREFLAQTLLHDMLVWPLWCNADEVRATYAVLAKFDTGAEDVTFHPYWTAANQAITGNNEIKVSYYQHTGRILAVIVNMNSEPQHASLQLPEFRQGAWTGIDGRTGSEISLKQFIVPGHDFKLIEATKTD